jgi:hypothetical protein
MNNKIVLTAGQHADQVFSGIAHFSKGAVFFWYGILTLGRWAGSFANLGWVGVPSHIELGLSDNI